ncbi:MAG: GTPase ObgE [Candidatus Omnitrophica bacterium]|nr:GTPase ObgE [Candidatus Omnitrophota bacterium]
MFIDQAKIVVMAGAGGNGCRAFVQPPFHRHARPSGGNGGDGGDVILVADPQLATLLDFHFRHEFRAERGRHGSGNNKTGRRGTDRLVRIPVGTVVYDATANRLLRDCVTPHGRLLVAKGGSGGVGNANAAQAKPGKPGQQRPLRLELKLIADVGLVGFPNAGKSSLLARLSTARPKIAPYPFTTRTPVLGVVSAGEEASFVACDIPGLIEGAHEGRGMGIQFLRHIERTKLLVHVLDMAASDGRDPVASFRQLNEELAAYNPVLGRRAQVVAANKMDVADARRHLRRFEAQTGLPAVPISCVTKAGIPELVRVIWQRLQTLPSQASLVSSAHE